jgi:hypothetical protein
MPIYAENGVAIGVLFVCDTVPRTLAPGQIKALTILSHQVQTAIELRSERLKNHAALLERTSVDRKPHLQAMA